MHREGELLYQIRKAESPDVRDALIAELEQTPIMGREFYERWLYIHDAGNSLDCWTESGYDSSLSSLPRDVQLLHAVCYGKSDIDNGGFHQFFGNPTGVLAPEMVEWFERADLYDAACIMKEAMDKFGLVYPREQDARLTLLISVPGFPNGERSDWDPFEELDDRFYSTFDDRKLFDRTAEKWLRETCGFNSLKEGPWPQNIES